MLLFESKGKSCSLSHSCSIIQFYHHVFVPILIASGQKHFWTIQQRRGVEKSDRKDSKKSGHERWKDREQSTNGRRAEEIRQKVKLVFTLNALKNSSLILFSHSRGPLPGRVLQKRFRLHNPLLPEKIKWKKRTREAQLIELYTGITLTCCSKPVSTRCSACGWQCAGIWRRVWSGLHSAYATLLTVLTDPGINVGAKFHLLVKLFNTFIDTFPVAVYRTLIPLG